MPVPHVFSNELVKITEVGEIKEHPKRPPYCLVAIVRNGSDDVEQVVLPGAKAAPHIVMDALITLTKAGISEVVLRLAAAETWKNRRIESFQVVPSGDSALIQSPLPVAAPENPPHDPAPASEAQKALEPELSVRVGTRRYNTSDGADRQMIRLPGTGPLSKLFEGVGYYKRFYIDDGRTIIVPSREISKLTFKSSSPMKSGSREVFFSGLKRVAKVTKLNAPVEYDATPHKGGIQLTKIK